MRAFTNTIETKQQAMANIRHHVAADKLIKGVYWEDGKGCAVGCQYQAHRKGGESIHGLAETVHGIPREVAYLEDVIFEGLTNEKAQAWPERFISAIPEGADLSLIKNKFMFWLLVDKDHGVIRFVNSGSDQEKAINAVAELHQRVIDGKEVAQQEWAAASDAAWAAARDAAWAAAGDAAWAAAGDAAGDAAWAAAGDAAWAAARDAAWAAARDAASDAAWAAASDAAWDAAWAAAWAAAYEAMSDELIELLEASKLDA